MYIAARSQRAVVECGRPGTPDDSPGLLSPSEGHWPERQQSCICLAYNEDFNLKVNVHFKL